MEAQEVLVGERDFRGGFSSNGDGVEQHFGSVRESDYLGADLLEDLDSYWEDINNRLTISRMVSDSVIKGMVKAVEQGAAEQVAAKESELASLKEMIYFQQLDSGKSESSGSPELCHGPRSTEHGTYCSFSDALVEHDKMWDSLGSLRNAARGQIKKLKKETDCIRGCSSMRRISSGSELVGLGGILQEKASGSLVGVDRTLDTLQKTLDNIFTQVDDMVHLAKASLCEWQQEQEFQRELEAMVIQSSFSSVRDEFEEKLWEQNASLCGSQSLKLLEKINEVSNLKKELDMILKSLSNPETGQLISHGSHDMDHLHRKLLSNNVSPSTSVWEGNGIFEEYQNGMPENWDAAQLKHMTKEEIVNYFNGVITKMRRNHESKVQEMTEEYFSLKREYLKEKRSSLPLRKDKDLDVLRKKIPEVILKLDDIFVEHEKLSILSNNVEIFGSLKDRFHSLYMENCQLRDSLADKRKEVKCLSSQVSDAAEKMLQHSLVEAYLLKSIENLEMAVEDAKIQASVSEEVYKCVLREMTPKVGCEIEELEMQSIIMQGIYEIFYREAAQDEVTSKCEIEDSDIQSLLMQELCGVIFSEAIKNAQSQIDDLNSNYVHENENRALLELKALEKEEELRLVIEEKEKSKQEIHLLRASLEEKEKSALEASASLANEKVQLELASQEINDLKDLASCLQTLVTERSKELDLVNGKLADALQQVEADKVVINDSNNNFELLTKKLTEADDQKSMLLAVSQENQNEILLLKAKENEQKKQMQTVIALVHEFSRALTGFECQVSERINKTCLRLQESRSQLSCLIEKTKIRRRTEFLYKQKLERRCADLQMAEAEVDLLGDEVDALLGLLERIYIALDHYSPVLQHYPGIMEILKMIKRELSGEVNKSA